MTETKLTDELTGRGMQTDHGKLEFGDLVVLILDAVLFIYSAWRSYHFLTDSVPDGLQFLALIGLWGLDIGAIAWSLVWIYGSTEKYQDWVVMSFFTIDLVGVVMTSLTDSLMYSSPSGEMTQFLNGIAIIIIPLVIVANVVAGFIYHMTSPRTKALRADRKAQAEHHRKMGEIATMQRDLQFAEQYILAKQETLDKASLLAEIKTSQDALEKATRAKLRDQMGIAANAAGTSPQEALAGMKSKLDALLKSVTSGKADSAETSQQQTPLYFFPFEAKLGVRVSSSGRELLPEMKLEAARNERGFYVIRVQGEAEPCGEISEYDFLRMLTGNAELPMQGQAVPAPVLNTNGNGAHP
jgi:hypothetical protein